MALKRKAKRKIGENEEKYLCVVLLDFVEISRQRLFCWMVCLSWNIVAMILPAWQCVTAVRRCRLLRLRAV